MKFRWKYIFPVFEYFQLGHGLINAQPNAYGGQLYHYRGISRYHFPMYLKEIEFRFNHRNDNTFRLFLKAYFGYVSP